jgi:hypothetical protein
MGRPTHHGQQVPQQQEQQINFDVALMHLIQYHMAHPCTAAAGKGIHH